MATNENAAEPVSFKDNDERNVWWDLYRDLVVSQSMPLHVAEQVADRAIRSLRARTKPFGG